MISFSKVNRPDSRKYDPHYQRHHLIPTQAATLFDLTSLTGGKFLLDDFGTNGLLLPCNEREALQSGRPLHRGPHPLYNEMVIERLHSIHHLCGQYDQYRSHQNCFCFKVALLQSGLRRGLVNGGFRTLPLNKRDPIRNMPCTGDVDAAVDRLYIATECCWPCRKTKTV